MMQPDARDGGVLSTARLPLAQALPDQPVAAARAAAPRGRISAAQCLAWLLWAVAAAAAAGCGSGGLSSSYGGVDYPDKNSSINGLGIFMKLCTQAGSRCFVANRLSSRLDKADAIILVGDTFHPPAKEARDWLEKWLADKPGRSVVYFGRDFDAEIYYRQKTLGRVPAAQRHRAAIDLALAQSALDAQWQQELADDAFCRWFFVKLHQPRIEIHNFAGPWASDLADARQSSTEQSSTEQSSTDPSNSEQSPGPEASDGDTGSQAGWPVRILLEPPRKSQAKNKPKWAAPTTNRTVIINPFQSQKKKKKGDRAEEEPELYRSVWSPTDINDDETWRAEWGKVPKIEVMLAGSDGTPLVTKLTSPRYRGSQIVSLVNGAPLLNGSIVQPHFRQVAHKLIEQLQPAKRIALLPFDAEGLVISNIQEEDEVAGLSVLTTWPMSIVVAHLAFLGVLICLALFPILGRPQGLRKASLSDFGQHAEALGHMLRRRGDARHALRLVAEYYRAVRGEGPPAWLKSAFPPAKPIAPPTDSLNSNNES